ncbi:hypothetical protein [Micromonospora sp. DT31]|uniref:hypothetical protein n=1 Tax=Micromonospora sp. DT31 TaxID=3393434 RepID=UPI003CF6AFEA
MSMEDVRRRRRRLDRPERRAEFVAFHRLPGGERQQSQHRPALRRPGGEFLAPASHAQRPEDLK